MKHLIATIIAVLSMAVPAMALDLGSGVALDGYAKYLYAVEDADSGHTDVNTLRLKVNINTNYEFESELGLTYRNAVRAYGKFSTLEHYSDTVTGGVEVYVPGLPVNAGVVAEYRERLDRIRDDHDQFFMTGLVVRLP
jgi:hypothetical protein